MKYKPMKYRLVKRLEPDELHEAVTMFLEKGWKPTGGVCYDGELYLQAIYKE